MNYRIPTPVGLFKSCLRFPAEIFLILGLIFGMLIVFKSAPLNGTDEFTHFPRVYQISQGSLWEKPLTNNQYGGTLPTNVSKMVDDYRNLSRESPGPGYSSDLNKLNSIYYHQTNPGNKSATAVFTAVLMYPPWAYVAPLSGLSLAKVLNLPLIWYVYLARITALLFFLILGWLAIRLLPSGKWFMLALGLLPTTLTQSSTISADGLLIGLVWLLFAICIAAMNHEFKLSLPVLSLIIICAVYISVIKDGYFLVGLLPLLIPNPLFISRIKAIGFKAINALFVVGAALLFTIRTDHAVSNTVLTPTFGMNINTKAQMSYILHHFVIYVLRVIWQPFTKSFDTTYIGIVGILTNRLIYLSILIVILLGFALYLGFVNSKPLERLRKVRVKSVLFTLAIFVGTYMLLATAFYLGNTAVGAQYVNGFYGRYFLPILPLLLIVPMTFKAKSKLISSWHKPAITTISVIALLSTLASLGS